MDLSIVILNYNTREHLRVCLQALAAEGSDVTSEVLVVDNASTDGSAEMVAASFPEVRLIRSPRNGGYAFGNNLALREMRGDAALLLNPDAVVAPGPLAILPAL